MASFVGTVHVRHARGLQQQSLLNYDVRHAWRSNIAPEYDPWVQNKPRISEINVNDVLTDSPEFALIVAIEQAVSLYMLRTGREVVRVSVKTENGEPSVTVKTGIREKS